MTLARLKGIICLAIPLMLAIASGDAAAASPSPSGQSDGLDTPVELPVVFPPVKNVSRQNRNQQNRSFELAPRRAM